MNCADLQASPEATCQHLFFSAKICPPLSALSGYLVSWIPLPKTEPPGKSITALIGNCINNSKLLHL